MQTSPKASGSFIALQVSCSFLSATIPVTVVAIAAKITDTPVMLLTCRHVFKAGKKVLDSCGVMLVHLQNGD